MANTATKTEPDITEVVNTAPLTRWYLRVVELNKKRISSPQEAIEILNELRIIKGKIIKGSLLEKSIRNLGASDDTDIDRAIKDLTEKEKSDKTSVVNEGKIKELVAEYEQYIENGLSEKEALYRIEKENEGNISAKEIESFIQRQSKIYQESVEIKKDFVFEKDNNDDEIIEDESNEIAEDKKDEVNKRTNKESDGEDIVEEFINKEKTEIKDELKENIEITKDFVVEKDNNDDEVTKNKSNKNIEDNIDEIDEIDEVIEDKGDKVAQKTTEESDDKNLVEEFVTEEKIKVKDELKEKKEVNKDFVSEEEDVDEIIENKSDEVAQKIIKELGNNNERVEELINRKRTEIEKELKETVKKVFSEEETTLGNGIIKIIQERDDSFIKQRIPISNSSIKTIQLELNNWIDKNEKLVIEYKGKVLEKKIKTEIFKKNPELIKEKKVDVENYAKFVKDFYCSTKTINLNKNKGENISHAESVGLSPGQISNGWDNLQAFTGLINSTKKPLELIDQYKTLVGKIGNKIPTGIKECDSLNVVVKMAEKSDKFRHLIEKTQNILNWKENLISSVVSKFGLDKFATNVAVKILGEEFVKNSLIILSQKSLEQGSLIILQSFVGGGVPALTVAAATVTMETATATAAAAAAALKTATASFELASAAATAAVGTAAEASTAAALATATTAVATATEAAATSAAAAAAASAAVAGTTAAAGSSAAVVATAAVAGTGIGIPVAVVMLAVQAVLFLKKQLDKIAEKLGISLKGFLQKNFGKVGGSIMNGAFFILGLPALLIGAISAISILASPVTIGVIGGFSIYQIAQGFFVSNLPPPKGTNSAEEIITIPDDPLDPNNPLLPNDPSIPKGCPSGWPASKGYITQGPLGTASHDGQQAIDIVIDDRRIYSTSTGIARIKIEETGCGHQVNITSSCNGQTIKMVYCHLSVIDVIQGQEVTKGQRIGIEGTTGSSQGPHLHYELWSPRNFFINDYLPVDVPQFCYRCLSF